MALGRVPEEAAARITCQGLEGDGVNSRLFELLWKRDALSDASFSLRIPDTVIFKFDAPSVWYFTSVDGTIKRKHKTKLNEEHIEKEFLKRGSSSGIVAYFVTTFTDEEDANRGLAGTSEAPTTMQYFDEAGLRDFLRNKQRRKGDGILQRFLEPADGRNNMTRAMWSPKVCLLERRVNRLALNDCRYDMYERAVTFEGHDFHSELTPVRGSSLAGKVHEIADSIVQHVAAVTNDRIKISRLALNFKVDHKDRMHLLFASSVRLGSSQLPAGSISQVPLEVNTVLKVPDFVQRAQTMSYVAPAVLQKTCVCPTCEDSVEREKLFELSYKIMIQYEEQRRRAERKKKEKQELESEEDAEQEITEAVPEALRKLHPRLVSQEYLTLRNEFAFLYKTADVCESCYLRFSTSQLGRMHRASAPELVGGEAAAAEQEKGRLGTERCESVLLAGTQGLEPNRLARRRDATRRRIYEQRGLAEAVLEAEDLEERRQKDGKMKQRARSCPKLPTWGPNLEGRPSWPPKPVLSHQPRQEPIAPTDPAPFWSRLRQDADAARHTSPPLVPRIKKVPPLRGHPYLKGIQDFAAKHRTRAAEVLGPTAAAKISACFMEFAATAMGDRAASFDETALPEDAAAIPREPARASQSNGVESRETPKEEVLVSTSSPSKRASPSKQAKTATESPKSPQLDDGVYDDEEVDEGVDAAVEVAQLWGKWPPSVGGRSLLGAVRSETPTTRPPSQGDGFTSGPSSKPGSRPSTRTSSHAAGLGFPGAMPQSRPSSSPAVGLAKRRSIHPPMSRVPMERPVSSPGLHGPAGSRPRSGACGTPYLVKNSSSPVLRGSMR
eukprot:TRINITY_DN88551_c0_g1_i1.p1 TRINITY_DN88551_c0_g1~~TRINITY_DN88551_c0_g1_i1.p1  ORF type:complete len:837 (+),score=141.65 TRINITY_DN88551_c0_g1_i1:44-2554(+)